MRALFAMLSAAALAACGADGEPVQPKVSSAVTFSSSGMSAATQPGLRQGLPEASRGGGQ